MLTFREIARCKTLICKKLSEGCCRFCLYVILRRFLTIFRHSPLHELRILVLEVFTKNVIFKTRMNCWEFLRLVLKYFWITSSFMHKDVVVVSGNLVHCIFYNGTLYNLAECNNSAITQFQISIWDERRQVSQPKCRRFSSSNNMHNLLLIVWY